VPVTRCSIQEFLAAAEGRLVLDVRSPGEYAHAHMPGAVSLPLFSNEERAVIGTAYKQESREKAIRIGLDYFGPKMRPMVEKVEQLLSTRGNERSVFVYCWRGGMRSGAVAWLLDLYGFKVHVLNGGYKSFRNLVLQTFEKPFPIRVLGGYTGSGKTEVLHALHHSGEPVIDLEGIAGHKGSAFGNIGLAPQPSQEQFENLLATSLMQMKEQPFWVEDESQRIGLVNIPITFWHTMRRAPIYFLDIPFEERLTHIVEGYGALDREKLASAIQRIGKRLGGQHVKAAMAFLEEEDIRSCFAILLAYYDKHYSKGLHNRENLEALLQRIPAETVSTTNARTLTQPVL
jgi:tRNA 2-selenouridine synthase